MKKKDIKELFYGDDLDTGESIYYEDEKLMLLFNGIVVDYFKGKLSWEFEVRDGYRTGIEKKYYETGELMEENETDHNTINGIAKEFYKNGKMSSQGIVIRNIFIDTIFYDEEGNVISKESIESIKEKIPGYSLVEKEIVAYREKYKYYNESR